MITLCRYRTASLFLTVPLVIMTAVPEAHASCPPDEMVTFYFDLDGDGYGDPWSTIEACNLPPGYVENGDDCNDLDTEIHPGTLFYLDADNDTYGDPEQSVEGCILPPGYVKNSDDCDDSDWMIYPGAFEIAADGVDQNCDSHELCYLDGDVDGYRSPLPDTLLSWFSLSCDGLGEAWDTVHDCDDGNSDIHPDATESPGDGIDQNCDGFEICYVDGDNDGYRPDDLPTMNSYNVACNGPFEASRLAPSGDCDDSNGTAFPNAYEMCDDVDNNCDGFIDEGVTITVYEDRDLDNFGDPARSTQACFIPVGYVSLAGDCDDENRDILPGAAEWPADGVDQNCDGQELCYQDNDDDGYRPDPVSAVVSADLDCDDPAEATGADPATDCNDYDSKVHPGHPEICDDLDNDCDFLLNEEITVVYYMDQDGDAHGNPYATTIEACSQPPGHVASADDCDDTDPATYPGAPEIVGDEVDQDCDGKETCFVDEDGDGYRPDLDTVVVSEDLLCTDEGEASDAAPEGDDCDDGDANLSPAVDESVDGIDGNCAWGWDPDDRIAFGSISPNDVFIRDYIGPPVAVSGIAANTDGNNDSHPSLSQDGRMVAYSSDVTTGTNFCLDIVLYIDDIANVEDDADDRIFTTNLTYDRFNIPVAPYDDGNTTFTDVAWMLDALETEKPTLVYARKGRDADDKFYDLYMLEVLVTRDDDTQAVTSVTTGRECNLTFDRGSDNAATRKKDFQPFWRGNTVAFLRHTAADCDDIYLMDVADFRDSLQQDAEACPTTERDVDGDGEEEENIPEAEAVKVFSDVCVDRSHPTLSPMRSDGTQTLGYIEDGDVWLYEVPAGGITEPVEPEGWNITGGWETNDSTPESTTYSVESFATWSPDGSSLLIVSDRGGDLGLWKVETPDENHPATDPLPVDAGSRVVTSADWAKISP